jgi:uncharacterized protein (TIGR02099 family)
MIHLFKSAAARAVTYGLIALIAIGVMIGAVRLTLPFADLFRSQIAQLLSETLGMQVEMSRFRLRLAGMVPRLTLEDVDLRDPRSGEPQLELLRLHLDLDLAASLQGLAPKVESLTLEGARLQVERRMDGTIVIAGLDGVEAGDPRTMTFFLANGRFLLTGSDIHWVDHRSKAPALKLADVQIRFDNDGARHRIGLRARLAEDPDSGLHLAADLRGEADRLDDWSGDLYIDLRAGELHPTMRERIPALSDLQMGEARLQAWNRVERSRVVESVGLIAAQGLALGTGPGDAGTPWLRAERLDARLRWRPDDSGWELIIPELTLDWAGGDRTDVAVDVRYLLDAPGGWEVVADARGLTLEDLQPALSAYVSSAPLLEAVRQAAPRGQIDGVRLHLGPGRGEAPHWAAFGQIRGLQLSPSEPIPGISGLDVSFEAEREGVRLGLAGEDVRLAMPWLFGRPQPLAFDRFSGPLRLTWSGESGARLESDGLNLENPHLRLQTRLAVELPRRAPGPGLDLYGEIEVSDAGALRHYFPSAKLKPKLRRWLDQAFLGGRIPRGSFLFQGRPADFPFENGQGRFEAFLAADDLLLKFNSKWPPLRAVDGVAWFNNARMDVDISAGRLLDVSVEQAHAEIPDVRNARAILVDGSAIGGFDNALQILAETPLANRLGALPDLFRASGTARVDLSMSIPLRRHELADRLSLRGILSWPGPASLAPAGTDLELSALSGRLRFNQRGLDRSELEAELWGSPLTILMEAEPGGDGEPGPVLMTVSGATSVDTLSRHLPSPIWGRLRGAAPWRLDLEIPNALITRGEPTLDYALTSDLRGLTAELPAPMGKTGAESRRLRLEGSYRPGRDRQLAGRYGDLAFNLSFAGSGEQAGRLQRGGIAFGSPRARLPATDGVHLSGRIGELDLPPWTGLSEGGGKHPLRSADLKVDRLRLPQGVLTDARLRLRRSPDGWDVEIQAEERAVSPCPTTRAAGPCGWRSSTWT